MQLIRGLLSKFYLNMFRASLCPSSEEQDRVLLHAVFCTGCVGCGCVELGREPSALCESYCSNSNSLFTLCHTVYLHKPRQYSTAYCTPMLYGIAYCC